MTGTERTELSPRDREWLNAYLASGEDLRALAASLDSRAHAFTPPRPHESTPPHSAPPSVLDLAVWLRAPAVRAALADWDSAQRRARMVRDEADRTVAVTTLRNVCDRLTRLANAPCPGHSAPPADGHGQLHADARAARPAPDARQERELVLLSELRRAATTILRTLDARARGEGVRRHRRLRAGAPPVRRTASLAAHAPPRASDDGLEPEPAAAQPRTPPRALAPAPGISSEPRSAVHAPPPALTSARRTHSHGRSSDPAGDVTGEFTPVLPMSPIVPLRAEPSARTRSPALVAAAAGLAASFSSG